MLVDGFEKNEVLHGFHWRELPMSDEGAAIRKFAALADEAQRWMVGLCRPEPRRVSRRRTVALWPDLEIRQAGPAVMVRVKPPHFDSWSCADVGRKLRLQPIFDWVAEEAAR